MPGFDRRRAIAAIMITLSTPPPEICFEDDLLLILLLLQMVLQPPPCSARLLIPGRSFNWRGRDVCGMFIHHPQELFDIAGETLPSFENMMDTMEPLIYLNTPPAFYRLSGRNRVLMVLLWLRSYLCYSLLSLLFDVSTSTVCDEINRVWPI